MGKVFLSHSSHDKDYVEIIANKLGRNRAIYDKYSFEAGEKTFDEILNGLNNCDLFVIFISDSALDSDWVQTELNIATENLNLGKLQQVFPIIIDPNVSHKDPRIPLWMREGKSALNIRYFESPLVVFRKIEAKLKELDLSFENNLEPYVGHEQDLLNFQNVYYSNQVPIVCVIASGFQGIGRTSFIKQCIINTPDFSPYYSPIVIDFQKNQSIEDMICKLADEGYGHIEFYSLLKMSMDEKVDILISQFTQIQNLHEFVIFKDEGALIKEQDLIWWLNKVVSKVRPELTFGITTKQHIGTFRLSLKEKIFTIDVLELDKVNKLKLLQALTQLNREDTRYFMESLTGHPVQIKYCATLIREFGLEGTKAKTYLLTEFSFKNALQIINSAFEALSYINKEQKELFMGYLAFLATYPNIPIELVLKINKMNSEYEKIFYTLLSLCICQRIGTTKDIITTTPLICDYFERNRIKKLDDIEHFLNKEFQKFKEKLKQDNIDEYCYSQLDYNLKSMIINEHKLDLDYKYLYPSVIIRSIVEMYNNQKYSNVLDLCATVHDISQYWDKALLNTYYYYYCMSLAHKKDDRLKDIVHTKIDGEFILDKSQICFIFGFYYKFICKFDYALNKFHECVDNSPSYIAARRELVEVYTTLEDYSSAMLYAKKNYLDYSENPFNIYQYFKCCIHQNEPDIPLIETLLEQLKKVDALNQGRRLFYPESQALYYRFIKRDIDSAIEILEENKSAFENKIFYYKNLFDLYEEKGDLPLMEKSLKILEENIRQDDTYLPLLIRRKSALLYFKGQSYDSILITLKLYNLDEHAKTQIVRHLDFLFKK